MNNIDYKLVFKMSSAQQKLSLATKDVEIARLERELADARTTVASYRYRMAELCSQFEPLASFGNVYEDKRDVAKAAVFYIQTGRKPKEDEIL